MNVQFLKNYSQQGLYRALDVFNYPLEYPDLTRILGFRFLLQWGHLESCYANIVPKKEKIIAQINEMVQQFSTQHTLHSNSIVMELVDLLLDFAKEDGENLLEQLRECKNIANEDGPKQNGPDGTIYGDSQSVHNKTITESVRKAAEYIVTNFEPVFKNRTVYFEKIRDDWIQMYPKDEEKLKIVFDRLFVDNALFNINYTVDRVFFSVLNWMKEEEIRTKKLYKEGIIEQHEIFNLKTAMDRMNEELIESRGYCSSGILSHVMNSIQGLTDDKNLSISISAREQTKSVIYNHLNKTLANCDNDKIMEGFSDGNEQFIYFVKKEITNNIDKWKEEYGDEFINYVEEITNEYTGIKCYE